MSDNATRVCVDDADCFVDRIVTSATGADLTGTAMVAFKGGAYNIAATWQGAVGPVRTLRIPLAGKPVGLHSLWLQVSGGTDFELTPPVLIVTRT